MSAGSIPTPTTFTLARLAGLVFGAGTQLVFLWTAYQLFLFLREPQSNAHGFSPARDALLALFFAWPHSLLLYPAVQKWLKSYVHPQLMGCVHCLTTCISLLIMFPLWTVSPGGLWDMHGWSANLMLVGFYGSWLALFYSLWAERHGLSNRLVALVVLGARRQVTAPRNESLWRVPHYASSGLPELSRLDMVHAAHVMGSCHPDQRLDRLHLCGQLHERSPIVALHRPALPRIRPTRPRLPHHRLRCTGQDALVTVLIFCHSIFCQLKI